MSTREKAIQGLESGLYKTQAEAASDLGVTTARISQIWNNHLEKTGQKKERENFDPQTYMQANLEKIFKKLTTVISQKGTAKHIEMALKLMGLLVEKREDTHKFELTPDDRIRIATQFLDNLRREYEDTGTCSVCGQCKLLCDPILLGSESELQEN